MSKRLAIRITIYSGTIFKEVNSDEFFHVPGDYQHDLLY